MPTGSNQCEVGTAGLTVVEPTAKIGNSPANLQRSFGDASPEARRTLKYRRSFDEPSGMHRQTIGDASATKIVRRMSGEAFGIFR